MVSEEIGAGEGELVGEDGAGDELGGHFGDGRVCVIDVAFCFVMTSRWLKETIKTVRLKMSLIRQPINRGRGVNDVLADCETFCFEGEDSRIRSNPELHTRSILHHLMKSSCQPASISFVKAQM